MKALSQVKAPIQYPKFWTEDCIEVAIKELDVRKLSAKDRMAYIMTLSRNAEAVYTSAENIKNAELKVKIDNIIQCFKIGLEFAVIAQINQVSLDFVTEIKEYAEKNGDDFTNFLSIL